MFGDNIPKLWDKQYIFNEHFLNSKFWTIHSWNGVLLNTIVPYHMREVHIIKIWSVMENKEKMRSFESGYLPWKHATLLLSLKIFWQVEKLHFPFTWLTSHGNQCLQWDLHNLDNYQFIQRILRFWISYKYNWLLKSLNLLKAINYSI